MTAAPAGSGVISDEGLLRGIYRWDLVALAINAIIGAGIFGLPSRVYALVGTYSLAAFVACSVVVALIILCFAEVSSRFDSTGGPYRYAHDAFGPRVGFGVGWLVWLARLTAFAAIINLLVDYLGYFVPAVTEGWPRAAVMTAVTVSLGAVNLVGVRDAALLGNLFTVGKLIPIVLFVVTGLFFVRPEAYALGEPPSYGGFSAAVLMLVFAFSGFEMIGIPAGEVREPRRNGPFAMLVAISVVAVLYTLIQVVCIGTLPELAASQRPLADAADRFLGPAGATVISLGALVSVAGTLNTTLLAGSRVPFAMAEQGQLPGLLAAAHHRFRTPHVAILVTAAAMLALALSGTFVYALTLSAIIRIVTYAVTCAALPVLRRRAGAGEAVFRAPAGTAVAVAALACAAWLLSASAWRDARDVAIAASIGFLLYFAYRRFGRVASGQ